MQLLVLIIKDVDKLDKLLLTLSDAGIGGATILDCEGMAERLLRVKHEEDIPLYGFLSSILESENGTGKMVLMALTDEMTEKARCVIRDNISGFDKPNTGVMFGIPLSFTEGIRF